MTCRGRLIILSGPSGAGKGTLRKILFRDMPELVFSISCTTREQRPGEVEGRDYFFIGREAFDRLVEENAFLEWANVHGNRYGTRRADVEDNLSAGRSVVLEIDVQGSRSVKKQMPEAVRIFITVPSIDDLESRLEDRGTETREKMALRLRNAVDEIRQAPEYDYVIVNDDANIAGSQLTNLVRNLCENAKRSSFGGAVTTDL